MKNCTVCKNLKPLALYNKKKGTRDGLQSICRECSKERSKRYYRDNTKDHKSKVLKRNKRRYLENRKFLFNYLSNKSCVDCGESRIATLQFDHINRKEKLHNISDMVNSRYSIKRIKEEINKCEVRCANCHSIKTSVDQNWYKDFT